MCTCMQQCEYEARVYASLYACILPLCMRVCKIRRKWKKPTKHVNNSEAKKRIAFTSTLDDLRVENKNKKKRKGGKSAMGKDDDLLLAVTFASKKKKGKTKASS